MIPDVRIGQDGSFKRVLAFENLRTVKQDLRHGGLHSVCEEARCPNRGECFGRGVATFLIAGNVCTRACGFCSIATGRPAPLDAREPELLAATAARLGLRHVVVTSVNRDDLADGGAGHFVAVIAALRRRLPASKIEVLVPDFRGDSASVDAVTAARPDVFNHNVETVPRLYARVRPGARYVRSLTVLARAAERLPTGTIKSGVMVGHGESRQELRQVFCDLAAHGCHAVTIGQYLQPTRDQLPVARVVTDAEFADLEDDARAAGVPRAWSGRFVRSSYMADRFLAPSAPPTVEDPPHG